MNSAIYILCRSRCLLNGKLDNNIKFGLYKSMRNDSNMKLSKEREKVDAFLNQKLIVRKGFEPIDIKEGIDWNYQHTNNANTYQTYLHGLGIVTDLLKVSIYDNKNDLLKSAKDIIVDWEVKNPVTKKGYVWKEHPVSTRINNIVEFQETTPDFKIPEDVFSRILKTHCDYLYNERNYKSNNHGLMMDYALLNASRFITNKKDKNMYIDKAMYRVKYLLLRDFSRRGVHLENSPEYHRLVLNLIKKIELVLKKIKRNLGKDETELINLAHEYKQYIIQPNNKYPLIGDTGNIYDKNIKKNYSDFVDYESGVAILQNKNTTDLEKSVMLTFKSGYHKLTHKHKDDLSYSLYIEGNELLVDSGKYSYNSKDPVRKHLFSPKGHNTIFFENKMYKLENPMRDQRKVKISRYISKPKYKMVTGINTLYENSNITRYNILTKNNFNIVVDRIVSKSAEQVYQNFNLHEDATVTMIDSRTYEITLNNEEFIIKTFGHYNTEVKSDIREGFVSREFNKYTTNKQIVFNQTSDNATFITAVFNKKNPNTLKDLYIRGGKLVYEITDDIVTIDL